MTSCTEFKKILVPLDGSALSERAIEPAILIGRCSNSEIILARAPLIDLTLVTAPNHHSDQVHDEARHYLASIHETYQQPDIQLNTQIIEGDPANAIVGTAIQTNADLIVMSTHGHSGLIRLMFGSVTEKVLRSAPCPVMAIRAARPIKRILIPLDGSILAERAIVPGLEIADRVNGEATLFRSVERVPAPIELDAVERGLSHRLQNDLIDQARDYLDDRSVAQDHPTLKIKSMVRVGGAAENILDFADSYGTDLIVMATHGRTGLQRWMYGSVTEKVLRSAPCSLMIIRSPSPELN